MKRTLIIITILIAAACSTATMKKKEATPEQKTIITSNPEGEGPVITLELTKGKSFYYPLMAAWLEDAEGNYVQTLFVPVTIATGVFKYGKQEKNKWVSAPKRAPQTLPYWSHKRGIKASDGLYMPGPENPVSDAYSGATPAQGFILNAKSDKELPQVFRVMFEINQNWDWNEYWTNDKYPDNENYKMSCQPALVYEAQIDLGNLQESYRMQPIGHSHYSGETGELFPDLSTLTTALNIADSIVVRIK
ncbi:MAG TPA: hypothetical protein VMV47_03035 [Bacteroidales bacterium]|nr:hypothetical protein [Bacteroidales bacterium]